MCTIVLLSLYVLRFLVSEIAFFALSVEFSYKKTQVENIGTDWLTTKTANLDI
jgi:hypothetical protein